VIVCGFDSHLGYSRSRGPAAKTPGPHPGNDGSSPSGITVSGDRKAAIRQPWELESVGSIPTPLTTWAHGPTGRHQFGRLEIRVRFPVGPLRKVAGYGWPGRSAKAVLPTEMRVRLPCLPLAPMVKRTSSHASNLGFRVQILVGAIPSPVVQRAGHPRDMGKIAGSNPAGTTD
jgi:hypothetical protein